MSYEVEIGSDGALRLPEQLIRNLGIKAGDIVSVGQSGSRIVVGRNDRHLAALARLRSAMSGYSVDQFLEQRRGDWAE